LCHDDSDDGGDYSAWYQQSQWCLPGPKLLFYQNPPLYRPDLFSWLRIPHLFVVVALWLQQMNNKAGPTRFGSPFQTFRSIFNFVMQWSHSFLEQLLRSTSLAIVIITAVADAITIIATTLHHHHHHQLAHHRQHLCPSLTFMFLRWPCCAWSFFNFPFSLCAIGRMRTRLMKVTVEVTMATTMMASVDHFPRGLDPSTERK
jgi:hypothetical protein